MVKQIMGGALLFFFIAHHSSFVPRARRIRITKFFQLNHFAFALEGRICIATLAESIFESAIFASFAFVKRQMCAVKGGQALVYLAQIS